MKCENYLRINSHVEIFMHKTEQVQQSVRTIQGLILMLRFSRGGEQRQQGERAL